jgi:integration host factor subunit alpha
MQARASRSSRGLGAPQAAPSSPAAALVTTTATTTATKTVIKTDLIDAVYAACPTLSRAQARDIFDLTLEELTQGLIQDRAVKLLNFGQFAIRAKHARPGRNPRTGAEVLIAPRRVLTFKPASALLAALNPSGKGRSAQKTARPPAPILPQHPKQGRAAGANKLRVPPALPGWQ